MISGLVLVVPVVLVEDQVVLQCNQLELLVVVSVSCGLVRVLQQEDREEQDLVVVVFAVEDPYLL